MHNLRGVCFFVRFFFFFFSFFFSFLLLLFTIKYALNAYIVDPDHAHYSAVSKLSLHCFPMYLLWEPRH